MSSGLIVALELVAVLGVVLGLGVWELVRLRRDGRERKSPGQGQGRDDVR